VGFFPDPINARVPPLNLTAMLALSTPPRHGAEKKAVFAGAPFPHAGLPLTTQTWGR
jgi:hypothetical protein